MLAAACKIGIPVFLSTPSARRATLPIICWGGKIYISIHALREEGDVKIDTDFLPNLGISIHALREEGDAPAGRKRQRRPDFYPRPPRGGRPGTRCAPQFPQNFYPRPPRGGRPQPVVGVTQVKFDFYPRPPRGGRPKLMDNSTPREQFLSTPSARRATGDIRIQDEFAKFLSTPSARRATGNLSKAHARCNTFLSTPSARRATVLVPEPFVPDKFLSTPSARRATDITYDGMIANFISIHALREEGDECSRSNSAKLSYFYPRPPRGGRLGYGRG